MKIQTKEQLIKKLHEIGHLKLEQANEFMTLSKSIEKRKEEKTLKEWVELTRKIINLSKTK